MKQKYQDVYRRIKPYVDTLKQRGGGEPRNKAMIILRGSILTVYSVEDESFLQQDINCLHQSHT